jgi:hypothetical protein
MSQTSHEFVRTPERREVYENCDVKCLFYAESVSEQTQQYYGLSSDEIRFIQSAARGQDSDYSECLLATSVHGRRRLEVRSGPFEHHVLDDTLDPWEWLAETEGIEAENDTATGALPTDLELTDLPHVMNRDMDLEMAMRENDAGTEVDRGVRSEGSPEAGTGLDSGTPPSESTVTEDG